MKAGIPDRRRPGRSDSKSSVRSSVRTLAGSVTDVHPGLYGERPGPRISGAPDARRDWRDLGALRAARRADLPLLGVCSGHQLLNLATGGSLHQHLPAGERHTGEVHAVRTQAQTRARALLGALLCSGSSVISVTQATRSRRPG